jgi:hypothetical protein
MLDPKLGDHLDAEDFRALSTWCENDQRRIDLKQWLGGGNTQAVLAVVLIRDSSSPRKGVLKYCPPSSQAGTATDLQYFRKALGSGPPGFAGKHLIGIDEAGDRPITSGSGGLFLLMKYAGDDYDTMATLLDREILGSACETIVTSTFVEWNDVEGEQSNDLSAVDFLREILGNRCEPGGSIRAAAEKLGVSCSEPFLTGSRGEPLSNPLAAATSGQWINEMSVLGFRGNSHGDLHADNILIPWRQQDNPSVADFERYVLIDLSTFSNRGLIAVDPAHLMLSIIARRLKEVHGTRKRSLAQLVLEPDHEPGGIPVELANAVRGIQRVGNSYFDDRGLYKEWRAEFTLTIAACALLFVGRDLPADHRRWFLELAGMAIDAFKDTQPNSDQLTQDQLTQDEPTQERDASFEKSHQALTIAPATSPTILSNELDSFRSDLMDRLRMYQGQLALDIGHISLRRFADHLVTRLEISEAALADDSANTFSEAQRDTIIGLNSRIVALTGLVRELALLVEWCVKPTRAGELSASRGDLTELREGLSEVNGFIESLAKNIEQAKRVMARQSGGGVDSGPRGEVNRPYRRQPIVAVNEYRR